MAEYLSLDAVIERLGSSVQLQSDAFDLMKRINSDLSVGDFEPEPKALDAVIRLLERRGELNGATDVLSALVRQVGLFPYADPENLSVKDQIAYEAHRPAAVQDVVFHRVQASVYRRLLEGENVVLSAPTSFGKSLIIDSLIASTKYTTIVIVVPTIALIDETRRRLARFGDRFKLVTHPSQAASESTIYVLTQERLLDLEQIPAVDLFVIDEFYKLDMRQDSERADLLNQALNRLLQTGSQFLMLGPSVEALDEASQNSLPATFIKTTFHTVAANVRRVTATRDSEFEVLVSVAKSLDGPTLIFCRSPNRIRQVSALFESRAEDSLDPTVSAAADWIAENFHPDWYVVDSLRKGIGVHHGRLPRSIAQWMVRAFNDGRLSTLFCTNTLIEGVNTQAKNIIIFDRTIAMRAYDYFTFNNIRGRSGRMFRHFVGEVILFHDPPQETLPVVDIPAVSQGDTSPESLLIQLDSDRLSSRSRDRLAHLYSQDSLSMETLRENSGVDPRRQVDLANRLINEPVLSSQMSWRGFPTFDELSNAGELILRDLRSYSGMVAGVASGRQLAYRMSRLANARGDVKPLIEDEISNGKNGSDAVEDTLEFVRYWPSHNLPRYLMALDRIQSEVLTRQGRRPGAYLNYAAAAESLFGTPGVILLEEYGIPVQLARRLEQWLSPESGLDGMLQGLASLPLNEIELQPYERELLTDSIGHL